MSSKKSKKGKNKIVSQNDLRKMMMDMKSKRSTNDTKSSAPISAVTRKDLKPAITNPDVLKKALSDRMKVNALLTEATTEPAKSLKRPQKSVSNMSVEIEKPSDPKIAKTEKKILKEAPKTAIKEEQKPPGGLGLGDYGSDSEEDEPDSKEVSIAPKKEPEKKNAGTSKPDKSSSALPEGFFDNPEVDAKMRGVETPANKMDKEWEKFQIEMQHETGHSEQIVEDEQEMGNIDRQIEEIDEQIQLYSRVEKLNVVRDEIKAKVQKTEKMEVSDTEENSDSDSDDSLIDWREKDAFL